MVTDHAMKQRDAEVVVAGGALLHDAGMSIHRADHEAYSLFLVADRIDQLLEGVYDEPERTVVMSEMLHAVIGHRRRGEPYTLEGGVVRVADALDMAQGRSRLPIEGASSASTPSRPRPSMRSGSRRATTARSRSRSR